MIHVEHFSPTAERQNLSGGEISGEKAMRARLEWPGPKLYGTT